MIQCNDFTEKLDEKARANSKLFDFTKKNVRTMQREKNPMQQFHGKTGWKKRAQIQNHIHY